MIEILLNIGFFNNPIEKLKNIIQEKAFVNLYGIIN